MLSITRALPALLLSVLLPSLAPAAITIHFDSPTYQVQPLGTVQTQISYDADPNTPGDQPLPGGLLREAFLCTHTFGVAAGFSDVTFPAALNSPIPPNFPSSIFSANNSEFAIASQLDPAASTGYPSTLLLTVSFRNPGTPGTYPLTLSFNPDLGTTPNFLDFNTQSSIDPSITFQGATITVLPEPASLALLLLLPLPLTRRRRPTDY